VAVRPFNIMSLCSGVGGLELGLKLAIPDARVVLYCEREAYAAATIVARMEDETLDRAPIWDDLTTFDGRAWRGVVDCISAGFPCQPFSQAGKQKGTADPRWLWPAIASIVRMVRPYMLFLENVTGLLTEGLSIVLADLAESGFDAEWGVFSAAQISAPHFRERVFILAYARQGRPNGHDGLQLANTARNGNRSMAEAWRDGREIRNVIGASDDVADADGVRRPQIRQLLAGQSELAGAGAAFPPGPGDHNRWREYLELHSKL
jgi:DNA (cytosine-5)-methyltransferase 1